MRKQELVYLHGLLREVRDYYEREAGEPVPTPEYDACDVSSSAIHRSKRAQEEAVTTLLAELTEAMEHRQKMHADAD
ncbi:UPF0058 family protein [Haloglomus salinum]|jgi:hypothetical protein|uniref:UPF0058 family protein n=1 Tax=Haloglomus salinum TaxID=2962673 RepID=UPI0020C9A7E5|nr:UPF0058 family protein [Haloglomus salinum]